MEESEETTMTQLIMKDAEMEVRVGFCRLQICKRLDKEEMEQSEKAAWIHCAWKLVRKARSALNFIYGELNSLEYPLGRKIIFVSV